MRYLSRFLLLMGGFALTTFGLMLWHAIDFRFDGIWLVDNGLRPHPLHAIMIGLALIPPTLWDIFLLEQQRRVG